MLFMNGRPGIGLVHKCVMVNKAHTRFKLSVDEPDAGSKLTSLSFKIRSSSHSGLATASEESEPKIMMFSGDSYLTSLLQISIAHSLAHPFLATNAFVNRFL